MGINVSLANSQANKLDNTASKLKSLKSNLAAYKSMLNDRWQAAEVIFINHAIDELNKDIQRIATSIELIGDDIRQTANEILNEEIAKAKAEAEAKAKAMAEAEAKAK